MQALPATQRAHPQLCGGRVRPVQQAAVEPAQAAVHQQPEHADHGDAHEHDVEHEQLPCPHHQVAQAFAGGQQLDRQQRGPAGRQCQAHTGQKRRQRSGKDQPANQQVRGQAQYRRRFAQARLGIAHAHQGVQGHRHDHRLDQHHQLEHFADAEQHHEQWHPGQRGDLRQGVESRQYQAFGALAEAQPGAEHRTGPDPDHQPQQQALQADGQVRPHLAATQFHGAVPYQRRRWQYLLAHPVVAAGQPPHRRQQHGQIPGLQALPGQAAQTRQARGGGQ